jgi:hypothetical protein
MTGFLQIRPELEKGGHLDSASEVLDPEEDLAVHQSPMKVARWLAFTEAAGRVERRVPRDLRERTQGNARGPAGRDSKLCCLYERSAAPLKRVRGKNRNCSRCAKLSTATT